MDNPVRTSTKKVMDQAELVRIHDNLIPQFVKSFFKLTLDSSKLTNLNKLDTDDKTTQLTFLILIHTTGFCFWNAETTRWRYNFKDGSSDKGQFAFFQAWIDYFNYDPKRFNLEYFSKLSFDKFKEVFQGGKNLYFLKERWEFVRDISKYLLNEWEGDIKKFILSANHRLDKLLPLFTSKLAGYDDQIEYKGQTVYFWKLAQLFIYDLIAEFRDDPIGQFEDEEYLTGLSDYKFPQLLEANKLLSYEKSLDDKIVHKILIPRGSQDEVEIRSSVIVLVDLLHEEYKKQGGHLKLPDFVHLLFMKAKTTNFEKPYHLTKNLYY